MKRLFRPRRSKTRLAPARRRLGVERLEERCLLAGVGLPFGATVNDTAEFMLGKVVVTPVFIESRAGSAADLYDWSASHIQAVKQNIVTGVEWWSTALAEITTKHTLDFTFDFTYADQPVDTSYEPIARTAPDYSLWVPEFLVGIGANTSGDLAQNMRAFNHAQRVKHDADWSFTIFVANAEQDPDGLFESCGFAGCFRGAFAFAGGLFMVTPSTRPASTISHEMGHIFWALDEYAGGGNYTDRRGYYNAQNLNAVTGSPAGFQQQASIMANGMFLKDAYDNFTSPASTFAQVGWRDSNGNGVFDVLDVPHTLTGTGFIDQATGQYRFIGHSSVQTLPNQNSSGLKNDITINKISRAQYRINGGDWQTAAVFGTYQADLDFSVAVPPGTHNIEIRTIDDTTGVTSPVFAGTTDNASSTARPGISGFVWNDSDGDGVWDTNEAGMSGFTVRLVNASSQPATVGSGVEPDEYGNQIVVNGGTLNTVNPAVTLSAVGSFAGLADVKAGPSTEASTGDKVFQAFATASSGWSASWNTGRMLRMDFATPTSRVQLDAIGQTNGNFGRLEAYNAAGQLLDRYTTGQLARGSVETMTIERDQGDIAYVLAFGHMNTSVALDNLRFGAHSTTVTGANGSYALPLLPAGGYRVQVVSPAGWSVTTDAGATQSVTVSGGATVSQINFGLEQATSSWQNPANAFDVNNDGVLSPLDALLIINVLNQRGAHVLAGSPTPSPPYVDVDGDGSISPVDALLVINELNRLGGPSGEQLATREPALINPVAMEPVYISVDLEPCSCGCCAGCGALASGLMSADVRSDISADGEALAREALGTFEPVSAASTAAREPRGNAAQPEPRWQSLVADGVTSSRQMTANTVSTNLANRVGTRAVGPVIFNFREKGVGPIEGLSPAKMENRRPEPLDARRFLSAVDPLDGDGELLELLAEDVISARRSK